MQFSLFQGWIGLYNHSHYLPRIWSKSLEAGQLGGAISKARRDAWWPAWIIFIVRSTWGIHITLLAALFVRSPVSDRFLMKLLDQKLKKKDLPYHQYVQLSILDPDNIYTDNYIQIYIYMYMIYVYVNTHIYIISYIIFERCEPSSC